LEIHLGLKGPATKPPALRLSPQELEALLLDLVRETEGMSGAELEELVRRAKARAFASNRDAILPEDFYHVLGTFRINKEERMGLQRRYLSWWESQSDVPVDYELLSTLIPEPPSPFSGQVAHT
jgi:SpoVK/Ycf46/Vps4 family AAA+-type ATPase